MRLSFSIGGHHQVEGHSRKDLPACFINELVQNKKIKLGTRKVQISKEHQQTEKKVLEHNMGNKNQTNHHR
jgi:hypothetical protein